MKDHDPAMKHLTQSGSAFRSAMGNQEYDFQTADDKESNKSHVFSYHHKDESFQ